MGSLTVTETVLPNGLTVLVHESHLAPVVTCWAGYRVGARNERPGITGASHWVEHMTFKGTAELGKGDVFRLTARHGGSNNGFTADDFTVYYETLPAAQLDLGLHIESQRMAHALFDPEETERERTVIITERTGGENNPQFELSERMGEAIFQVHPYRYPVIGTRADLERLTHAELLAHYRTYYVPNNAVLAVVGDVDTDDVLKRVERYFGGIPAGPQPPRVDAVEPPQAEERRVEVRKPGAAAYLRLAYRAPEAGHPDCYPLIVLDAVLSGGKSVSWGGGGYMGRTARVYRALVETRLAVNAGTGFHFSVDPGVFTASLTLRAGVDPEQAERALRDLLEETAEHPPTPEELRRALRQTEAQIAYSRDGVTSQGFALAYWHLLGHWSDLDRYVERLRAVTAEDVTRVAREYLRPERCTVGWFIPDDKGDPNSGRSGLRNAAPSGHPGLRIGDSATAAATGVPSPSPGNPNPPSAPSAQSPDPSRPNPQSRVPTGRRIPQFPPGACFADGRQNGLNRLDPRREELDNGIVLLWNESADSPAVSLRGTLSAGAAREEPGQEGLASFTARLLRRGTERRGAQEIAAAVEDIGASFAVWAGSEEAGFSAKCLGDDLTTVLDVLQEVLEAPSFAEAEIAKTRGEIETQLREHEDSPRSQAERAAFSRLYPESHPYSRSTLGTHETVAAIGREQLRQFHEAWYREDGMRVSVAGDVDADRLRDHLSRWFAGRPAAAPLRDFRVSARPGPSELRHPMAHKSQVELVMGGPGIPRDHPDFYALSLASLILGGFGLMGRLGEKVRDEQGLAYHVSCRATSRLWSGEWIATAGLAPENVERAIAGILREVERLREGGVTEEELSDARESLIGSLPLRMETNDGIAAYLLNSDYYGLGLDYIHRYPGLIRAETRETLARAFREHVDPARFHLALAGPL